MDLDQFSDNSLSDIAALDIFTDFKREFRPAKTVSRGRILARQIDSTQLLRASQRLRYQVYCLDRKFLPADEYPGKIETDEYDAMSTHFGVFVDEVSPDRMIGMARLVPGEDFFPLQDHCTISPQYRKYFGSGIRAAEVSRLMISQAAVAKFLGRSGLELRRDMLLALYKAVYSWVEARQVSLLFAAMETSLAGLLRRTGFPFVEIGPEVDYYGRVFPYVLDIEFGKHHLRTQAPEIWQFFLDDASSEHSRLPSRWTKPAAKVA
jgi:N-acyl amino acid synthase of PEP-CTERM/exosortase system